MKKFINKIIVPLSTIFILLISCWLITVVITSGHWYYRWQYKKNNLADDFYFSYVDETNRYIKYDESLIDDLSIVIPDYLFNKLDSMQIEYEGKPIFSNQAIKHMGDVKTLFNRWQVITLICSVLLILSIIYMVKNKEDLRKDFFKKVLRTYLIFGILIGLVCIAMLIDFGTTFTLFHHVLFPTKAKFVDAFFGIRSNYEELPHINNLLLVTVLQEEVFLDAGLIIAGFIIVMMTMWLILANYISNKRLLFKRRTSK